MSLDDKTKKRILDFVKKQPRTVQEISEHIKKNWRTAERYISIIQEESGFINTKIFREGTRGALKIVYWNFIEDIHSTSFQEELLYDIMHGKRRPDFSPFDIYQYITPKKRKLYFDKSGVDPEMDISDIQDLVGLLRSATKQIIIFSGNLSWVNAKQNRKPIIKVVEEIAKKGIAIKIIARVSIIGIENVKKLFAINKMIGREVIEIRHRYQPLRGMIIDNRVVRFKEIRDPLHYQSGELKNKIGIYFEIYDKEWIDWIQKIFWKMYSVALPAEKRLEEMKIIQENIVN
jgi:hypothetical protein